MSAQSINFLAAIAPIAPRALLTQVDTALNKYAVQYGVDNNKRLAAFLAQANHETGQLKWFKEIWGPTAQQAKYQTMKGLGNYYPNDGFKFRGRGLFHVTGRANYLACSLSLFNDNRLLNTPEILEQPEFAVKSALWYWKVNGLNKYADKADFEGLTRAINGGTNGIMQRQNYWVTLTNLFNVYPTVFFNAAKKKSSNIFYSLFGFNLFN